MWYAKVYDPLTAGSIDGTDTIAHDHAVQRAQEAVYKPPSTKNPNITNDPINTIFVGRLNPQTTEGEYTLREIFERFGAIKKLLTGDSRGYAFIEYTHEKSCQDAYKNANRMTLDDKQILVDYERSHMMQGWVPRRLGGGFGGRKESGQLRFGARDRPFKRPFVMMIAGDETFFNRRISRTTNPPGQSSNKRPPLTSRLSRPIL
ncbi:11667_t:CDS:2 [Paraglomus brasilianum]|uniref:11667_t:CDS:1 n=1 Tax=Paraglomus brasilianum TaxID=144538 RepID=A0A9N9ARC1_9GLOM|nr:11667_t:CDS:2 [Paraglomus brasilianum]